MGPLWAAFLRPQLCRLGRCSAPGWGYDLKNVGPLVDYYNIMM
jgi:hypothetical protein